MDDLRWRPREARPDVAVEPVEAVSERGPHPAGGEGGARGQRPRDFR